MRFRAINLIFLCCFCGYFCNALPLREDTLQYTVQHFTDENGLPQNSVKSITRSSSGFIWFTTENGLVRYDGHSFKTFNKDNTNISSNRFVVITPELDHPDRLYTVTDAGDVVSISNADINLTPEHVPYGLYSLDESRLQLPGSTRSALPLPNLYKDYMIFSYYCFPLNSHSYYVAGSDTLSLYNGKQVVQQAPFRHNDFWGFFLLQGLLYHVNNQGAVHHLEKSGMKTGRLTGAILQNPAYRPGSSPLKIFWNRAASHVFVYLAGSLYLLEPDGDNLNTRLMLTGFDFTAQGIVSLYYDEPGQRFFLGSFTEGLFVLKRKQFYTTPETKGIVFYAQAPYTNNTTLTAQGIVAGPYLPARKLDAIFKTDENDHNGLLIDRNGYIWKKCFKVLYKFNKTGTSLLRKWEFPEEQSVIYQDLAGTIWLGIKQLGLYRLDTTLKQEDFVRYSAAFRDITYLQEDSAGNLWIGCNSGLHKLHLADGAVETIWDLQQKRIRSLYARSPDEVWITTTGDGFYLYTHHRIVRFPLDEQRYLAVSHSITEDDRQHFWIPTNKGLFEVPRADLLAYAHGQQKKVFYLYYDKSDGFNTNEFNGGSEPNAVKLQNGYISFPSLNGLVWLYPPAVRPELPDKNIFIDKVEMDQRLLPTGDTMQLSRNFNRLRIYLTTPYYGNAYNLNMEYSLTPAGEAQQWQPVDDDGSIVQAGLPSGEYILLIRKQSGFGIDNYAYKSVILNIPAAFYETTWFKVMAVLLFGLLIWAYTRLWLLAVKRKNKVLEFRISKRTASLQETLTALRLSEENLLHQMRMQERLIAAITHDVKSPLKYVVSTAAHHYKLMKESAAGQDTLLNNAQMIYDATYRMYHFIDNLLQYIKSNAQYAHTLYVSFNVSEVIMEKVNVFAGIATANNTNIVMRVPPDLQLHNSPQLMGIVVHNILDNATKFTFNGTITLFAEKRGNGVAITIKDTGIGMPPQLVEWSNRHAEYSSEQDLPDVNQKGFGLIIIHELLKLVGGTMHIESEMGKGTTITLYFREA